jgi:hypothetical protein
MARLLATTSLRALTTSFDPFRMSADDGAAAAAAAAAAGAGAGAGVGEGAGAGAAGEGAGGAAAAWYEGFTDKTIATSPIVQRYKSAEELAKGYLALETRFGIDPNRRIDLPEDLTNAEQMRSVWTKLGLPDKPEGYGLAMGASASEQDKALLATFTKGFHEIGVPAPMAKQLFEIYARLGAERTQAAEAQIAEAKRTGEADLKSAWGQAYEQSNKEVDLFIDKYFPEIKEEMAGDKRFLHPLLAKGFAKLVAAMAEPGIAGGRSGDGAPLGERPLTPLQAEAAARALETDPVKSKALSDKTHPMHKQVIEERRRLGLMAKGKAPS